MFGLPSGEHAGYVGKRGVGVNPDPAKLSKICPDGAPNCQGAPNGGLAAPVIDNAHQSGMRLTLQGHLQATPLSRYSVEVFTNHGQQPAEGEIFVGEVVTTSDTSGHAKFSLILDSAPGGRPATYTATATSSDGATSEFSRPVAPSK